jgi:carboxyl-terminal processing protease
VRKSSFAPGILFLVVALTLPAFILAQQGRSARRATDPNRPAPTSGANPKSAASASMIKSDLSEALAVIQSNHADGKALDYNNVFKGSITSMLSVLDPHSTYFDQAEYASFRTEQRSEYFGIGATIEDLREGTDIYTYIRATFPDSPAHRAGLRFGDKIVEVDGKSMKGQPYPEVRKHLLGPRGSTVKVTVEHAASKQTEIVPIIRDAVSLPSIAQAYMLRPSVGYVAMTGGFNLTTDDEFGEALRYLHSKGMNMLVLDLRGNRGGLLIQAVRVANRFLQRGQMIVTQKGRFRDSSQSYAAVNENPDGVPVVVLVNGDSASAAEIVAGALQDHDRALIVGETTFGKGLVQFPFQLDYETALLLTIAKYYTPSGRLIQRDYSNGGNYDYYFRGGVAADRTAQPAPQTGPESHTDTGRAVYGGGGISPDETVKPGTISAAERHLRDVLFAYSLELVTGRAGLEAYKIQQPIEFDHELMSEDYPITDKVFSELKKFAAAKPMFKVTPDQLDKSRTYAERQLRYNILSAAYGFRTATQVFNDADPQIGRAVDVMPRARELAQAASRARARG